MEKLIPFLTYLSNIIALVGGTIIFIGAATATYQLVITEIKAIGRLDVEHDRQALRHRFGYYILLGLEFLIAADVLRTLIHPGMQELITLGVVVLLRTVISVTLNWELSRAEHVHGQHP